MIRALALIAPLTLAACEQAQQAADAAARETAKRAVIETLATRFPTVPREAVTPYTDCVIDNASAQEIASFARDAVVGVTDDTAALVGIVLQRPETQQCIVRVGVASLAA